MSTKTTDELEAQIKTLEERDKTLEADAQRFDSRVRMAVTKIFAEMAAEAGAHPRDE
jgi:hypothetical protein